MDLERYKNLVTPAIQAGEITKLVRKAKKEVRDTKQDSYYFFF